MATRNATSEGEGAPGNGRLRKEILFGLGFVAAAWAVATAVLALLDPIAAKPGQIPIAVMGKIRQNLAALENSSGVNHGSRVAVLGDSTVDSYPPGMKVTDRLREALNRPPTPGGKITVSSLAFPAMGPSAYYFLADRIIEAQPDLIVWEISFTHASERWQRALPRPELAAWISPERIPSTLAMPMEHIGLTADELLFYPLIVQVGQEDRWRDLLIDLSRVDKVRGILEESLSGYTRTNPEKNFTITLALRNQKKLQSPANAQRYNTRGEIEHFGSVLEGIDEDHPTLRFVGETVRLFSEAGIPTLVYLNPINIEHLEKVGVIESPNFQQSLAAYRGAVSGNGGHFLDLHRLFPDGHFADMSGHFRHDEEVEAPTELADRLADFIVEGELLRGKPRNEGRVN